ncbi:MAG: anhydro-N-acetylmuramic acid kinase [Oscillatoria sp. PMC 1068.18]|nr:anhydro-N-acetylmuramic acid kinase [Oscillatoria sp. PMC 1076.18]MEC4988955.1 anhydro-N-acetylmuramic acid kinase [Oscillatoria sp. PMC 1068.18]
MTRVIGLISGTSVDGIDAAFVEITETESNLQVDLLTGRTFSYPSKLKEQVLRVGGGEKLSVEALAELDDNLAAEFARAALEIQSGFPTAELIGSHGQTVFHRPPLVGDDDYSSMQRLGYSLQLGRGEVIAYLTGIPTISNFRAGDLAAGGQGAPLVSKVDAYLLADSSKYRCVQNLGGIGNVTYLPPKKENNWQEKVCGWDTGPGNILIDLAVRQITDSKKTYDENGAWAAKGTPCLDLVDQWLKQEFFTQAPPKSTGRELFGQAYLSQCWQDAAGYQLSPADWLATLTELTVASIVHSYRNFLPLMPNEVLLCGGGSHNLLIKKRLQTQLASIEVLTTDDVGLNSDYKEAIAFAVLAYWRQRQQTGNLPQVTGAKTAELLGEIHLPLS